MGTAVVAGGNPAPVLEPGKQVLHLMAHLVQPLAVRDSLVAVPSGRDAGWDALLPQPGADLVAVVSLQSIPSPLEDPVGGHQHRCVAALPFPEEKADRASFTVAHHRPLAAQSPARCGQSIEGQRPLVEAGGGAAMGFDIGGIQHQHLFWCCTGFCLCVGGSCQFGEEQPEDSLL